MEVIGQIHASANLPRGKSPQYQLDRSLGGTQSRSGRGREEKSPIISLAGNWIPVF
jgi:hypothetical protein